MLGQCPIYDEAMRRFRQELADAEDNVFYMGLLYVEKTDDEDLK